MTRCICAALLVFWCAASSAQTSGYVVSNTLDTHRQLISPPIRPGYARLYTTNSGRLHYVNSLGVDVDLLAQPNTAAVGTTRLSMNVLPRTTVQGSIDLREQSGPPSASVNYGKLFASSSDGLLYYVDDMGTLFNLVAGQVSGGNTLFLSSSSGMFSAPRTVQRLTADTNTTNSDTVASVAMTTTTLAANKVYKFRYWVLASANHVSGGFKFAVNYSGAQSRFLQFTSFANNTNTASGEIVATTDNALNTQGTAAEVRVTMTPATLSSGIIKGESLANTPMPLIIEGYVKTGSTGSLTLTWCSRLGGFDSRILADTMLEIEEWF